MMLNSTTDLAAALPVCAGLILLLIAAWLDIATRRLPNWIAVSVALLGLTARLIAGDAQLAVPSALLVFVLAFGCWQMRWIGGGDVKLIAAAALLPPGQDIPMQMFGMTMFGACLAMGVVMMRPMAVACALPEFAGQSAIARVWRVEQWRLRHGGSLPYAVAVAAGTIACLITRGTWP